MNNRTSSGELSDYDMYNRMFLESCYPIDYFETDVDGKIVEKSHKANSLIPNEILLLEQETANFKLFLRNLWEIEQFVDLVTSSKDTGFVEVKKNNDRMVINEVLPLGKYFFLVDKLAEQLELGYEYSLKVGIFLDCWMKLKLGEVYLHNPRRVSAPGKRQFELFNDFIELIRTESKTPAFRKKISRAKEKFERRCRSADIYIDALFKNKSTKLLVLRLDLAYRREIAKNITIDEAEVDLNHFFNNRRGQSKLFKGWVGHIVKKEWSPQKGVHFHLIIFMDLNLRCKDGYLAQAMGEYWKKISGNITGNDLIKRGIYWNCNDSKHEYKRCGIGPIEIGDIEKRKILLDDVVSYLAKTDQQLQPHQLGDSAEEDGSKIASRRKLFLLGKTPKPRVTNVGRPRKEAA